MEPLLTQQSGYFSIQTLFNLTREDIVNNISTYFQQLEIIPKGVSNFKRKIAHILFDEKTVKILTVCLMISCATVVYLVKKLIQSQQENASKLKTDLNKQVPKRTSTGQDNMEMTECANLKKQLVDLEKKNNALQIEITQSKAENRALQDKVSSFKADAERIDTSFKELQRMNREKTESLQLKNEECDKLLALFNQTTENYTQKETASLEKIKELQEQVTRLTGKIKDLKEQQTAKQPCPPSQIKHLSTNIKQLRDSNQKLLQICESQKHEIKKLNTDMSHLQQQHSILKEEYQKSLSKNQPENNLKF